MQRNDGCGTMLVSAVGLFVLAVAYMSSGHYIGYFWTTAIAVFLLVLCLLVAVASRYGERLKTQDASNLSQRLDKAASLSGAEFEQLVADILRANDLRAEILGGSGDQGVDIIVTEHSERIAIQCKNYAKAVGNKPVQEVHSGALYHNCTEAWVVAPRGYTKGAHELANKVGVSLYDESALRRLIKGSDEANH